MDTDRFRSETKGCQDKVYLNSAGASLVPDVVINATQKYLDHEAYFGGYHTESVFQSEIENFYTNAALLINSDANNIAFCFNATNAYAKAVACIPFECGDKILVSDDDYISNYFLFINYSKRFGIEIIRITNHENGDLDLGDVEQKIIEHNPKLISVTHVPSNSGKIQDVEAVGLLAEKYNVWYIVDACQSMGQITVDVKKIKCDFLSVTGRKFLRGPRGTGFLYVSDKVLKTEFTPLSLDMKGATWVEEGKYKIEISAKRFELWEANYANVIGFSEAINYVNNVGIENIQIHNSKLCKLLKNALSDISHIRITEQGSKSSSIVTFTSESKSLEEMKSLLDLAKVFYGVGFRQYALIDFNKKDVDWAIRFSPHYFNTEKEIMKAVNALKT